MGVEGTCWGWWWWLVGGPYRGGHTRSEGDAELAVLHCRHGALESAAGWVASPVSPGGEH